MVESGRLHFHGGVGEGVSLVRFRGGGGIERWCCDRWPSSPRARSCMMQSRRHDDATMLHAGAEKGQDAA